MLTVVVHMLPIVPHASCPNIQYPLSPLHSPTFAKHRTSKSPDQLPIPMTIVARIKEDKPPFLIA